MGAGAVADLPVRPLSQAIAWALQSALRFAVGTCIVALLLATMLSGDATERFATTAYLAAIFAAVILAIQCLVPAEACEHEVSSAGAFPSLLGYAVGVVIFLSVVAALVSEPGGEALAFIVGFASIVMAVFARSAMGSALARGSFVVVAAMIAASLLQPFAEPFAIVAYVAAVCATLGVAMECWRLRA